MTVERLENHYLTWRFWVRRYVVPVILLLLIVLGLAKFLLDTGQDMDEIAVIVGFFSFYYIFVRGGHLYMIRTTHDQLKTEFAGVYPISLSSLPAQMSIKQIGFSLARIKAELYRRIQ